MSLIVNRKSIRKYTNQKIEKEKITELLKAGMQAPSAKNQQPWKFIIVDNREILDELSLTSTGSWMLKTATLAIIPIILPAEKAPHFAVQDLSAATENILLEATNLGLGSVWIGIYPLEERVNHVEKVLKITGEVHPFSIIALGYPLDEKETISRYDESRIYYNKWGE